MNDLDQCRIAVAVIVFFTTLLLVVAWPDFVAWKDGFPPVSFDGGSTMEIANGAPFRSEAAK